MLQIAGTPRPKGSMRIVDRDRNGRPLRHARLIADNPHKLQSWDRNVAGAAIAAMVKLGRDQFPWRKRPIAVVAEFRFARPDGHFGKRGLRPSAPLFMAVKPDVDKVLRATLDAMTGLVYDDDSRIVAESSRKAWCGEHETPGATLELTTLDEVQLALDVVTGPVTPEEDAELMRGPFGPTQEEVDTWDDERRRLERWGKR